MKLVLTLSIFLLFAYSDTHQDGKKYDLKEISLELSEIELNYLQKKKLIKMCVDPNWMPLEKIEEREHIGIAAEYIDIISKMIDTPIELLPTDNWSRSLEKIQKRECDILSLAQKTPKRESYLLFTTPYIDVPIVLATHKKIGFIDDVSKILEMPLGVVRNYSIVEILKNKYPNINIVEVDSVKDGLLRVESEKIFGFLDNALVINYELAKSYLRNTIINGQLQEHMSLGIAVRSDETTLFEIVQKAHNTIKKEELKEIVDRWSNITFELERDYRFLAQVLFFVVATIGIFTYWNLKLKEEIEAKKRVQLELTEAKRNLEILNQSLEAKIKEEVEKNSTHQLILMEQYKLAQMGEMIENIAHQWRQPLAQINSSVLLIDAYMIKRDFRDEDIEAELQDIESLTNYMSETIDHFKEFFHCNKEAQGLSLLTVVQKSLKIIQGALKNSHIKVEIEAEKNIEVISHGEALQQVIITLLNNAKDALIANNKQNPLIIIKILETKNEGIISISDNGGGVKEEIKDRVFDPYFTTKHKSQGTGLGLYMAKMITKETLQGALGFQNQNNGASFEIRVPKALKTNL